MNMTKQLRALLLSKMKLLLVGYNGIGGVYDGTNNGSKHYNGVG